MAVAVWVTAAGAGADAAGADTAGSAPGTSRVALVDAPRGLRDAVALALAPWAIEVVVVTSRSPGNETPGNAAAARALVRAHHAAAVVWLSLPGDDGDGDGDGDAGAALWLYDAASDRVIARPLPHPPPFDGPTAAAVALSVKTLLRHSRLAPDDERLGAEVGDVSPRANARFRIETIAGARMRPGDLGAEPRLGIGAVWATGLPAGFSVAATIRAGPGVSVERGAFTGNLSDLSAGASARVGGQLRGRLGAAAWLGPTLRRSRLEGEVPPDESTRVTRLGPSVDAGGLLEVEVGPILLQLRAEGGLALRRQRYVVRGGPTLHVPIAQAEVGLGVAVPIR